MKKKSSKFFTSRRSLLLLLVIFLFQCTPVKPLIDPQIEYKSSLKSIPKEWKQNEVIILSDSTNLKLFENDTQNKLAETQIQWYYIQSTDAQLLKTITVGMSGTIENEPSFNLKLYYPDSKLITIRKKKFKKIKSYYMGEYHTNDVYYQYTIPQYSKGLFIRLEVERHIFRPNFISRKYFGKNFPTLSSNIFIDLPLNNQIKLGLENTDSSSLQKRSWKSPSREFHNFTYKTPSIRSRKFPSHLPEKFYPGVFFSLPPLGVKSLTWIELGDYYLDMMAPYRGSSQKIEKQFSSNKSPKGVQGTIDWLRESVRYHADERGVHSIIPRRAETIFNQGFGDCKEMSSLLNNILALQDVSSSLTLVNVGKGDQLHPDYPSLGNFNHMVLQSDAFKNQFYDPTNKKGTIENSYYHFAKRWALVLKEGKSSIVEVQKDEVIPNTVETKSKITFNKDKGIWEIAGEIKLSGQIAIQVNNSYDYVKSNQEQAFLKSFLQQSFEIEALETSIKQRQNEAITINYKASFQKNYIDLQNGGFKIDKPSTIGGYSQYTTLKIDGIRSIHHTIQKDEWIIEGGSFELVAKPLKGRIGNGEWIQKNNKIFRNYKTNHLFIHPKDKAEFRKWRKNRNKFLKPKVWIN